MERLTHVRNNGIKTGYWSPNKKEELVQRLAAYENTGLTPEEIRSNVPDIYVGEWIPCSERLPDDGREVLVELGYTYKSDYTMCSIARYIRFDDGESYWCDNRYGYLEWPKYSDGHGGSSAYKVLRWMPLPEPYKGG